MVRRSIPNLPVIIDSEVNRYKSRNGGFTAAMDAGGYLSNDPIKITRAYKKAQDSQREFKEKLKVGSTPTEIFENKVSIVPKPSETMLNIVVILFFSYWWWLLSIVHKLLVCTHKHVNSDKHAQAWLFCNSTTCQQVYCYNSKYDYISIQCRSWSINLAENLELRMTYLSI